MLVYHDNFVRGIWKGHLLSNNQFELLDSNDNNIFKVKYSGVWLLSDNGYHNWSTTIAPSKISTSADDLKLSQWIEPMRKDVECTFGILKERWRILKTGIRLKSIISADKILDDVLRTS